MKRKLASIQVVESLKPIVGADSIEQARVLGWTVVVKKGEFVPGDKCVFFEIDAQLPDGTTWAEFMAQHKYRVKTLRLRGVLSQGLALPTAIVLGDEVPDVGADVTERLGVTHYDYASCTGRHGSFPALIPQTGEVRLQSAPWLLDELCFKSFYVTTKLDGVSCTFYRSSVDEFIVCSHDAMIAYDATNPFWQVAERYKLHDRLPVGYALQGELCGPGIRKNRLGLRIVDAFMFNAYDVSARRYLCLSDFMDFCRNCGVGTVPIDRVVLGHDATMFEHTMEAWLQAACGTYAGTKNRREGIVVRPMAETFSERLGARLSFKVINNEFLLKDEV